MSAIDSRRLVAVAKRVAPALTLIALVALAWGTVRGRGESRSFPDALLQAEGIVLAALVFVMGLNQSAVQRGFDAILEQARQWEEQAANACAVPDPEVDATRVWTWASRDAWVMRFTSGEGLLSEARDIDEAEKFGTDRWSWERLEWGAAAQKIRESLDSGRGSAGLRRRRERQLADLERRMESNLARAREFGRFTGGLRRFYGDSLVIAARSHRLDKLLSGFTYLLVAALLVGLIRAGPAWESLADPDVWVAVALPALAGAYRAVVARQLLNEADALVTGLQGSWMVHLHDAEKLFGRLCGDLAIAHGEGRRLSIDQDSGQLISLHLDLAETHAPLVPWLASLQGRLHFAHALVAWHGAELTDGLSALWRAEAEADLSREFAIAESRLRRACQDESDPVAALALSSCLELQLADGEQQGRTEAEILATRALDLLDRIRPNSWDFGFDRTTGVRLAHTWISEQAFLLRPESSELSARFDDVFDRPAPD